MRNIYILLSVFVICLIALPVSAQYGGSSSSSASVTLGVGSSATFELSGGHSHTVTMDSISGGVATFTVESTPVQVALSAGQSDNIDTDANGADDLTVTVDSVSATASVTFQPYTPPGGGGGGGSSVAAPTLTAPTGYDSVKVVINDGAEETASTKVTLAMPGTNADKMAISNTQDFAGSSWEDYSITKEWVLEPGVGEKTIYALFRKTSTSKKTGVVSGSIKLVSSGDLDDLEKISSEADEGTDTCALTPGKAYKLNSSPAVYYITNDCKKRPFNNSTVYFTYFNSWQDTKVTTKLGDVMDDDLGFMPWGPKYDPKYGALVKSVDDPKVYLLLNGKKYHIDSETTLEGLGYSLNMIEDIDLALLDKYVAAEQITDFSTHLDGTLIKYVDSPAVYKLEDGKKRHILNEKVFESLGYRWDRIVVIPDTEVYEDGLSLE